MPLTPLEFGVLRHLSGRAGKVITRQEFLRDVWGTGFTGGSNVVDVVMRSLRRKLGDGASCLQTVRGSGYRLAADWRGLLAVSSLHRSLICASSMPRAPT